MPGARGSDKCIFYLTAGNFPLSLKGEQVFRSLGYSICSINAARWMMEIIEHFFSHTASQLKVGGAHLVSFQ